MLVADRPGFVVNRLLIMLMGKIVEAVENGTSVEVAVDWQPASTRASEAAPMAAISGRRMRTDEEEERRSVESPVDAAMSKCESSKSASSRLMREEYATA